jgi:hypothetical protein
MKFKIGDWVTVKDDTILQAWLKIQVKTDEKCFRIIETKEQTEQNPSVYEYLLKHTENFWCYGKEIELAPFCNTELFKALNGGFDEV